MTLNLNRFFFRPAAATSQKLTKGIISGFNVYKRATTHRRAPAWPARENCVSHFFSLKKKFCVCNCAIARKQALGELKPSFQYLMKKVIIKLIVYKYNYIVVFASDACF